MLCTVRYEHRTKMNYSLSRLGITDLNAMQQDMLQAARRKSHIVLLSPTGSGKTLAYLLPLLERLQADSDALQALVIVPSRELAIQTVDVARRLSPELRAAACYGGRPAMEEHQQLKGLRPHLVAATPGRMLDHLNKGNLLPDGVTTLIIDEFDKSLEFGFQEQMMGIIALLPAVRQRILLSATESQEIPRFVGGSGYARLSYIDEGSDTTERIRQHAVHSPEKDKLETLRRLLCTLGEQKSIVFVGFRESVERIGNFLEEQGVEADIFHGGMEQRDRERALYRFMNGSSNVFVSTDLAARGLDIDGIDNVIHYHLPTTADACTHRNGRTARWDKEGHAFFILGPEEHLPEFAEMDTTVFRLPEQTPAPVQPLWITLYIGKGKKDKISRGDIAGFLMGQGGLMKEQVGRIDVLPHWAYAAVDRKAARQLLARIKGQKIKGQKTIYAIAGR